jgi:hypothetical protein
VPVAPAFATLTPSPTVVPMSSLVSTLAGSPCLWITAGLILIGIGVFVLLRRSGE